MPCYTAPGVQFSTHLEGSGNGSNEKGGKSNYFEIDVGMFYGLQKIKRKNICCSLFSAVQNSKHNINCLIHGMFFPLILA